MENANDKQLSFPQRNWFILCVIVAILSPVVVHLISAGARSEAYKQSTEVRAADTTAASATGTAGSGRADTSYKVASPPGGADTANKAKPAAK
jgi:hypothetical protein